MRGLFVLGGGVMFLMAGALAGCSGSSSNGGPLTGGAGADGSTPGPVQTTSGPYEPLAVGVSLTYHVNDTGVTYDKVSTVQANEDAGGMYAGTTAFRVHDQFPAETQTTWYQVDGLVVKRLHDNAFDSAGNMKADDWYAPYRLRVDETPEHLVAGTTWVVPFTDNHTAPNKPATSAGKSDTWRVDAVDEPIAVPFGTFLSLHVTRTDSSDGSTKSFWFVRGVGKVKESTSGGHSEELANRTP